MGGSGLAEGKNGGIGESPRASRLCVQRRTSCFARLLHVCTAFSSPFGKASPSTRPRLAGGGVDREDGLQIPAFARPEKTRLTDIPPPASAPLETFCPLPSARHGKMHYAAKVPASKKRRCMRLLTGALCLPQLALSITTLCLSALRYCV
jgi:hypothetical protein